MKVFNVPSYLEDLTGLTQLLQDTRVSEVRMLILFVWSFCIIVSFRQGTSETSHTKQILWSLAQKSLCSHLLRNATHMVEHSWVGYAVETRSKFNPPLQSPLFHRKYGRIEQFIISVIKHKRDTSLRMCKFQSNFKSREWRKGVCVQIFYKFLCWIRKVIRRRCSGP